MDALDVEAAANEKRRHVVPQVAEPERLVGGLERLAELVTADDARLELVARVAEAAARTTWAQKIRALGRVLGNGPNGHATLDEAQILAAAIDAIEAPHIQVLVVLRNHAAAQRGDFPPPDRGKALTLEDWEIAGRLPGHKDVLSALLQVLSGHWLIEPVQGGFAFEQIGKPGPWAITSLGRACMTLLEAP